MHNPAAVVEAIRGGLPGRNQYPGIFLCLRWWYNSGEINVTFHHHWNFPVIEIRCFTLVTTRFLFPNSETLDHFLFVMCGQVVVILVKPGALFTGRGGFYMAFSTCLSAENWFGWAAYFFQYPLTVLFFTSYLSPFPAITSFPVSHEHSHQGDIFSVPSR